MRTCKRMPVNLLMGGSPQPGVGTHLSDETKQKISRSLTGRHLSEETRKKLSLANKGANNPNYRKHPSKETRMKQSLAKKGRRLSEETKKKLSVARQEVPWPEEIKRKISASVRLTLERKKRQRAYHEKYYEMNKEKILSYIKKHRKDNREHYTNYYRKRKLDRIDAIFETFGYSVEALNRMGAALEL